jgi:predicted alpha/beta superfamily hydrolase
LLEILKVHIKPFNQDRLIRVYLPKSYGHSQQNYPVLYMHDGQNVFDDHEAIGGTSLDLLAYLEEKSLDVIVVAIDQSSDRMNEYTPWKIGDYSRKNFGDVHATGGKGKHYIDYIAHDLKPYIDQHYRTLPKQSAIAGISLGGLISLYAACRYPHLFPNVGAISSAYFRNQEDLETLIETSDLSSIKSIYMDCGSEELPSDPVICRNFVTSNQRIYDLLKAKVPTTKFCVYPDAQHHYAFFKERISALFNFLEH